MLFVPTRTKRGFTLVELLTVVIIVGVLATLALVGHDRVTAQARDTAALANIRQIATAVVTEAGLDGTGTLTRDAFLTAMQDAGADVTEGFGAAAWRLGTADEVPERPGDYAVGFDDNNRSWPHPNTYAPPRSRPEDCTAWPWLPHQDPLRLFQCPAPYAHTIPARAPFSPLPDTHPWSWSPGLPARCDHIYPGGKLMSDYEIVPADEFGGRAFTSRGMTHYLTVSEDPTNPDHHRWLVEVGPFGTALLSTEEATALAGLLSPPTTPTVDVDLIMNTHQLLEPDETDLRYRCSGCAHTSSAAFSDPVRRHTAHLIKLAIP